MVILYKVYRINLAFDPLRFSDKQNKILNLNFWQRLWLQNENIKKNEIQRA